MPTIAPLPNRVLDDVSQVDPADLRIPLVIGVTGHRDLRTEDITTLEERVSQIFTDLRGEFPHTPWIMVSPLAEGADRLVARVALRHFRSSDQLVAPMPMPREAYAADFEEPGSLADFDSLADGARMIDLWAESDGSANYSQRATRDRCYAATGAFLVGHCQILIALWDGRDTGSPCGTAKIVEYRRKGLPAEFRAADSPFGLDEIGPVYSVITPRRSNSEMPAGALGPYEILPPFTWENHELDDPAWRALAGKWAGHRNQSPLKGKKPLHHAALKAASAVERASERLLESIETHWRKWRGRPARSALEDKHYHANLAMLDRFNECAARADRKRVDLETSKGYLIGDSDKQEGVKHRGLLNPATGFILDRYAVADVLAMQFQKRQRQSLLILCTLAVVAGGMFHWYAHMVRNPILILGYLGVLVFAFCLFVGAKRGNVQQQYLDYRALAEGMRIAFIWATVGNRTCVADLYLQQQRSELDWIRFALRNWQFAARCRVGQTPCDSVTREHYEMVCTCWVHDQALYHSKTARLRTDYRKLFEIGVLIFFTLGTLLAVFIGIRGLVRLHGHVDQIEDWLLVFTGLTTTIAAAIAAFAEKMGISAESRHFSRMVDLFMHASSQMAAFDKDNDTNKMNDLLLAIGKEALDENAFWVILHRERPLEVPMG